MVSPARATALQTGLVLLGLVGAALLLARLQELVIVLLIAVVLAEGLHPLVGTLQRAGVPRRLAAALPFAAIVAGLAILGVFLTRPLVTEARTVLEDLPLYESQFEHNLGQLLDRLSIEGNLATQAAGSLDAIARSALTIVTGAVRGLIDGVVVLLLSFLWLSTRASAGGFLLSLLPAANRTKATTVWGEIARGFAGYIRGVAINMVVIGVVTGIAAALLGLPAPALLGVLAGMLEMIPIAGPIVAAIPAILLAFTISPYHPAVVAIVYFLIQQIEAHTLVPLVMRHSVGLPALAVVVALAAGAALAGIGGAIVAVPLAFALQVLVVRVIAPVIRARLTSRLGAEPGPDQLAPDHDQGKAGNWLEPGKTPNQIRADESEGKQAHGG
jgi:predicted PurR-regulated permease PerM